MSRAEEVVERVAKRWMEDDDYDPHDHETRQAYYRSLYFVARVLVTELGITAEMVEAVRTSVTLLDEMAGRGEYWSDVTDTDRVEPADEAKKATALIVALSTLLEIADG